MRFEMPVRSTVDPAAIAVDIDGRLTPVRVRRSRRARRLILRLEPRSGEPIVTIPACLGLAEAQRFVDRHRDWLSRRLATRPQAIAFRPGTVFPLRGEPCLIEHCAGRGLVRHRRGRGEDPGQTLSVPGFSEHVPRRVMAWLKAEARRDLIVAADRHEAALGRRRSLLRVGDARSRWGSCTAGGVLTFSWRLILAPPWVLDYLAAHEVAHLAEMNHGERFWNHVARLCPDHKKSSAWLKAYGPMLQVFDRS